MGNRRQGGFLPDTGQEEGDGEGDGGDQHDQRLLQGRCQLQRARQLLRDRGPHQTPSGPLPNQAGDTSRCSFATTAG